MKMGLIGILIVIAAVILGAVIGVSGDQWATDSCRIDCFEQQELNEKICESIPRDQISDYNACYVDTIKIRNRCVLGCNGWW